MENYPRESFPEEVIFDLDSKTYKMLLREHKDLNRMVYDGHVVRDSTL